VLINVICTFRTIARLYHPRVRPELRHEIERWFLRRGVPQLVAGYTSERQMDNRAAPLIIGWVVLGAVLFWGVNPLWPALANVAGVVGVLAFVVAGWLAQRWLRGRRRWAPGMRLDFIDVVIIGPLIGIGAGVVDGSPGEALVAMLNSLLGIGVIYVIVGIGLLEIGLWSLVHFGRELFRVVGLLSRTLPVLLILVLFLLFSSEIWEAAHGLAGVELAAILVLVTAIAVALVLTGVRSELNGVPAPDWPTLEAQAAQTPAAPLLDLPRDPAQPVPKLSFLQRVNVTSLLVIGQLIQSFFVALTVMAFLLVFSLIALPGELQARWIGEPVAVIVDFDLLGELRTLSFELVVVTAILGAVVGLYFTGLAVNDAAYRPAHFGRLMDEVRPLIAGWAVYRSRLPGSSR
jgi:hypothetical protein